MKLPCEICVRRLVPLIKRELVLELYEEHDLSQASISKLLDITRSSVTQYLKGLRAKNSYKVRRLRESSEMITKLAKDLVQKKINKQNIVKQFCEICKLNQESYQ